MTAAERAARTMLGGLDDPEMDVRDLLHDLRTDNWSSRSVGEAMAIDVATQIWSGQTGTVTLAECVRVFDEENFTRLLRALIVLRPDSMNRLDALVE